MGVFRHYVVFFACEIGQTILRPMENHGENPFDWFRCHPKATRLVVQFDIFMSSLLPGCPDTMANHAVIDHNQCQKW